VLHFGDGISAEIGYIFYHLQSPWRSPSILGRFRTAPGDTGQNGEKAEQTP
jgi:hypothetical protein